MKYIARKWTYRYFCERNNYYIVVVKQQLYSKKDSILQTGLHRGFLFCNNWFVSKQQQRGLLNCWFFNEINWFFTELLTLKHTICLSTKWQIFVLVLLVPGLRPSRCSTTADGLQKAAFWPQRPWYGRAFSSSSWLQQPKGRSARAHKRARACANRFVHESTSQPNYTAATTTTQDQKSKIITSFIFTHNVGKFRQQTGIYQKNVICTPQQV